MSPTSSGQEPGPGYAWSSRSNAKIDQGRRPVYTITALLLPLVLLYGPFLLRPRSASIAVMTGLGFIPVTLLAILFAVLAIRRQERWRWLGFAILLGNAAIYYWVIMRR